MNLCAVLLFLLARVCAESLEGPTAGCTFEEDSDPSLCEYRQAQEDDFDWQLVRTYSWPHMTSDLIRGSYMLVNSSQYGAGQRAQLMLRPLSENDTHCVQFSYFLYSRDGHSPGGLSVYVRVNGGSRGNAVWNVSGSQGRQWHQVELAVSTFWPSEYQIVFEATVSSERKGYIGLDDIVLLNYPCSLETQEGIERGLGRIQSPGSSKEPDDEVMLTYGLPIHQVMVRSNSSNLDFEGFATVPESGSTAESSSDSSPSDAEINIWSGGRPLDTACTLFKEGPARSVGRSTGSEVQEEYYAFLLMYHVALSLFQRRNGVLMSPYSVTSSVGERRLVAWFQVGGAQRGEQDLYRCLTQSTYGAAVSNFAELIVRVPPTPIAPPQLLRSGPTYLIIQLNTNSIVGDGPVIRREIVYRASHSPWSETHGVNSLTYKVWHLEPDTEYRISVLLTRPGEGGTGPPGPPLVSRTKCAEPMRPLRGLTASEIQSRQLLLQWEPVGYNLTRCHTYSLSLCYRYSTAAGGGAGGNNATVRECLSVERNPSRFTLRDLPPFHAVHVRLALANPEGKKESREVTFQTEEDMKLNSINTDPPPFAVTSFPLGSLSVSGFQISYQSIESSDPSINVPGPRRTVSKLKNETYHMFSGLHPGTTYLVSVRARTAKGFGQTALTEITTNISAPAFDYEDVPSPLSESESTITVLLRPALGRGAPVSAYHVVVVEEDGSRQVRRRELGHIECFPAPSSHGESPGGGGGASGAPPHYYTAELTPSSLPEATPFTVGDNHTYNGYWNTPLDPSKNYLIYFQASSNFRGETRINCIRIARKEACKDHKRALEVSQHAEDMGLILGACAGGLVVLILLLGAIVVVVKKGRDIYSYPYYPRKKVNINKAVMTYRQEKTRKLGSLDCSTTEHSTLQQDDRTAHTFMDSHNCTVRNEQRSTVNESSSLLGGSPRRHCRRKSSPYHTGQLHPAVRVADLLQHINQMKTGEGYGFKQEYESFFDGWDINEKKDKTKGRHDTLLGQDRHRVKMHSLLADPNSDYVNANYIDIRINREVRPKQDMIYDFWRMVWQENCYSIVMITKLVEVGRVSRISVPLPRTLVISSTVHCAIVPCYSSVCSMGAGRTGCYIVLDVMLDMAECEGVVDIYNCVKTLCSRRINMIQTEEQYIFIHDAILEACLCGETAIPISEFTLTYKDMLSVDSQTNTSQLREEFQTLNSVTPHLDVEECSVSLLPRNREKNRSMDVLPPDRALAFLVSTEGDSNNYINAALMDSFLQPAAFVVTPHPLPTTTADFWRLVFDYGCTSIVMLNQLNQSNSAWPCLQYWPETGMQQFGPMTVELLSRSTDDNVVTRLFRVTNITRDPRESHPCWNDESRFSKKLQEGHLVVRHFQFLRWSAYREIPDSKKAFLNLLAQVQKWLRECGDGRTVVHCLNGGGRSGTFCACTMIMEMVHHHNMVDVFYAVKTLRNSKPNMVESMEQYRFCYELALEYLDCLEVR
ncbi:receptor-type tyrosine-protein phosphatase U-like [Sinocyclocheilus grahami]|uniref:receptor-type tyrosine-protein phosphatase U-like n=1 Tax=Sinocyclocheilus grahami TaxID=75366 RepID=UPI0007ACD19D|nr:PREDICTED: receptor-type tyrosine-protein phosphatase U-like [Sinocyclocheilus grahami]